MTLGQKIKQYRKRSGISQFNLELEIGAASGHISRIENGQINPTKEIIVDIAYALKLKTSEIASLFGIEIIDNNNIFEETTNILSTHDLMEVLDRTVNNLIFRLGYLASCVWLTDGDTVRFSALTKSNIAMKGFQYLDRPVEQVCLSLSRDSNNLTVRAIMENQVYLTNHTHEYTVPAVPKIVADKVQAATGDKSNIIFPLSANGGPFGAIVYVKKYESDFRYERETLGIVSRQVAVAISTAIRFGVLAKDGQINRI